MPNKAAVGIEEKMQALKMSYLTQLKIRMDTLKPLLDACEQHSLSQEARAELQSQAHKLSGSGATYGFPDISEQAKALEEHLIDHPDAQPALLIPLTRALLAACNQALAATTGAMNGGDTAAAMPTPSDLPLLLVVDDDAIIRTVIQELFQVDARIITGINASEALDLMTQHQPDLVLLDDKMPGGMSGLRMLEFRQSLPDIKDIPVIMLTASDKPEEVMRALMAGATDYIVKPFNTVDVATKIRGRLQRQRSAVLIADDDEAVRTLLEHKFQTAGCKVVCASDGAQAWAMMLKQPFSLIVLDRMMPGYDGMTLLRMMRAHSDLVTTPVVFLTARHYGSDVLDGLNKGAADYITKPFNPDEVVARCLRLMTSQEA